MTKQTEMNSIAIFSAEYAESGYLKCTYPSHISDTYDHLIPSIIDINVLNKRFDKYGTPFQLKEYHLPDHLAFITHTTNPKSPILIIWIPKNVVEKHNELPVGMLQLDSFGNALVANECICEMFNETEQEFLGRNWCRFFDSETIKQLAELANGKSAERKFSLDLDVVTELGKPLSLKLDASTIGLSFSPDGVLLLFSDLTAERRHSQLIESLATHDQLTQLLNRRAFLNKIEQMDKISFCRSLMIFIDVDKFKLINDRHGHEVGDQVLKIISKRLDESKRFTDVLGRMGGDEFALCLPLVSDLNHVENIAKKFARSVNGPAVINGIRIEISISLGLAWAPRSLVGDGISRSDAISLMLDQADKAMYFAKNHRPNDDFVIFDHKLNDKIQKVNNCIDELRFVVENDLLTCHFQAICDTQSKIVAVEALGRFLKPLKYHASIQDLIETSLESQYGKQLLDQLTSQALEHFVLLHNKDPDLQLNINIDVLQLQHESFSSDFKNLCLLHSLPLSIMTIEITEVCLEKVPKNVKKNLNRLIEAGCKISMDDFGIGYSNLQRLLSYNFHQLKIDHYFIKNATSSSRHYAALKAMVAIGRSLNQVVLAEGIETKEQRYICQEVGIDLLQGFLLSIPCRAQEMIKKL
ncbi:hypothetical protein BCU68_08655 [Vibrio sp. 10N.286.49.B3]|uniref:sensor domain-containing protein n=1 Tax=Vibrio sp. 10N.286.49.B3 TaxID=1880855 RepID=UPI000C855151|nr:GGDEF domain-containing protein [Vibrio sp. 10N.286.49.B3]PMH46133.1 hypothetical protein BCU68_08655 [Vibrio sp. 10N.286.49.B3]